MSPHRANVYNRTSAMGFHVLRNSLSNEEEGLIHIKLHIIILFGMIQEAHRLEKSCRVNEVFNVTLFSADMNDELINMRAIIQINTKSLHITTAALEVCFGIRKFFGVTRNKHDAVTLLHHATCCF